MIFPPHLEWAKELNANTFYASLQGRSLDDLEEAAAIIKAEIGHMEADLIRADANGVQPGCPADYPQWRANTLSAQVLMKKNLGLLNMRLNRIRRAELLKPVSAEGLTGMNAVLALLYRMAIDRQGPQTADDRVALDFVVKRVRQARASLEAS